MLIGGDRAYIWMPTPYFGAISPELEIDHEVVQYIYEEETMSTPTLDEVRHMVNHLSPHDQVRLIHYITERLAAVLSSPPTQPTTLAHDDLAGLIPVITEGVWND